MATSTVHFEGTFTLNTAFTRGDWECTFTPPSNISGKLCYVEVKLFHMTWDTTYTTPAPYHAFVLRNSWAQVQTMNVEASTQGLRTPLAIMTYGGPYSVGAPTLVQIPAGPHPIKFWVQRLDLGPIGAQLTDLDFTVLMTIVAADSRQTPLG